MESEQFIIEVDLDSFRTCTFCLRFIPIVLVQAYCLFLFAKELFSTRKTCDRMDKVIFLLSTLLVAGDLFSVLVLEVAISVFSHVARVIWTLALYFIFLRFVFQETKCSKVFLSSFLLMLLIFIISIKKYHLLPVRFTLLVLYVMIGCCGLHQILMIRQIEGNERARKKSMNRFLKKSDKKQIERPFLERRKIVEYRVISSEFKYHIKLRKSFCMAILCGLGINYFFLWDLEGSRSAIGQFFVIVLVELFLPSIYYLYTSVNQWVIEKFNHQEKQKNNQREHKGDRPTEIEMAQLIEEEEEEGSE